MKRIYIYVNGILNMPADCEAWTDRAVTWTIVNKWHEQIWSEKYEYFSDIVFRRLYQRVRAARLYRMIFNHYRWWNVVLVAHSNGCDVVMRMLEMMQDKMSFDEFHFFAPACSRQSKYELNSMIDRKQLKDCRIYLGGNDTVMQIAEISTVLLSRFGLGYGDMGAENPESIRAILGKERVVFEPTYGHSTWWKDDEHFELTMQRIFGFKTKGVVL